MKYPILLGLAGGIIAVVFFVTNKDVADVPQETIPKGAEMVAVIMPDLDDQATRGQGYFKAVCAKCHGPNAGGLDGSGPPLVHRIYEPGHHGDVAFVRAARLGVQSHHWRFGNMPPVPSLTDADLSDIISFIRNVQRANGIS